MSNGLLGDSFYYKISRSACDPISFRVKLFFSSILKCIYWVRQKFVETLKIHKKETIDVKKLWSARMGLEGDPLFLITLNK